jgi:hypothetical protein
MNSKNQIDALRNIDLEEVLLCLGAKKDHYDKSKWHTAKGTVSLNGHKFFNWSENKGGGGAIDLAMHLGGTGFRQTILWLQHNFPLPQARPDSVKKAVTQHQLILPQKVNANMHRVFQYLTHLFAPDDSMLMNGTMPSSCCLERKKRQWELSLSARAAGGEA